MGKMRVTGRFILIAILLAIAWSLAAPWLTANRVITVGTEFGSYGLCFFCLLLMGLFFTWSLSEPSTWLNRAKRRGAVAFVLVGIFTLWTFSNRAFFFWKMRAIPASAWAQMVQDLEEVRKRSTENGTNYLVGVPPKSLQQLGVGVDYGDGTFRTVNFPDYAGPTADIVFGNNVRVWGLYLGPESGVTRFWPGCKFVRVGTNAFFYVGGGL